MIYGGEHLRAVREWIQRKFCFGNGERVTWGKHERLESYSSGHCDVYVDDLERLAQDIRDAVLNEYGVKPKEHIKKFVIIADNPFSQDVDTSEEAWTALFDIDGPVGIYFRGFDDGKPSGLGANLFYGSVKEAREWILKNKLEEMNG